MKKRVIKTALVLLTIISVWACSKDDSLDNVDINSDLNFFQKETISYFNDIALGFEFSDATPITRKWKSSMKIAVLGNPTEALLQELDKIIFEINELATDGFIIEIVNNEEESNFYIFFGSHEEYKLIHPELGDLLQSNWGLFNVFYDNNILNRGYMYVDTVRANSIEQKHLLREELTQSLGLAKDSDKYSDSIFQSEWTTTIQFSKIDKELIRLLYHPNMSVGLNEANTTKIVEQILLMN